MFWRIVRQIAAQRRSPQGGLLTLQYLLPALARAARSQAQQFTTTGSQHTASLNWYRVATWKKCRDWRGELRSLGVSAANLPRCNTKIVPSVLFASYCLISSTEIV